MKAVSIHDIKGKVVGKFSLDETYFDGKINKPVLHQAILMYSANQRRGCASTKTRAQKQGGGRKPWRQKGTGRARVGTIRSPLWKGGGVIFGPHPRHYGYNLPKNIKRLALRLSLNAKIKDNDFLVVDTLSLDMPKTKKFAAWLLALKAQQKPLVVIEKHNCDILRASRNIPGATVKVFNDINAQAVLTHNKVIFTKQALENLIKLRKQ